METKHQRESDAALLARLRGLADQAFSRAAGAPLLPGNAVRVLHDATENYPAWWDAIRQAERYILFESYIISNDEVGRQLVDLLVERARAGVKVRLLYDWLGTWGSRPLWRALRAAGVEVRCFNPPRIDSPLGWVSRDHRKTISVDGKVGFVTGLCVSARWLGRPDRNVAPWRDTGLQIRGPAVADLDAAFAAVWAVCGDPLHVSELTSPDDIPAAGDVSLRVVASVPTGAGLYRLDQIVAALARRRLWLTDAYFVGVTTYVQALGAAARDGVDVRLLVPGSSDIPALAYLSRAGYRQLLETGVRVFEWNGTMLHAKTAVADDRWARIGSTNLNIASWLANYELDVAIENETIAKEMADQYEQDLTNATEIVLGGGRRAPRPRDRRPRGRRA
ncbi:MAG: phospholipase D-like domain-containing protein, partial [Pseudomonadota bacterium]